MPVEPVPKREVPAHIPKPDYATESEALESIPARWSGVWGGRVFGTAEEVGRTIAYGLRDVRVGSALTPEQTKLTPPRVLLPFFSSIGMER